MKTLLFAVWILVVQAGASIAQESPIAATAAKTNSSQSSKLNFELPEVLQSMSGHWDRTGTNRSWPKNTNQSQTRFWQKMDQGEFVRVHLSRIQAVECYDQEGATITTEIGGKPLSEIYGRKLPGTTLIMLTFSDASAIIVGMQFHDDIMTLRYPADCCSRSGYVVSFKKRVFKKDSENNKRATP